jgi:tetratricopeptide (TPR) repeat protein
MQPHQRLFAALLLILACPLAAFADTVHLKNGKTLEGEVVKEGDGVVIVRVTDGEIKLRAEDVEAIERQSPVETALTLARQQFQLGNTERAIALFEDAFRSNPSSADAKRTLAGAYSLQGAKYRELKRFAEARAAYLKLRQLDPKADLAGDAAAQALHELQTLEKDADAKIAAARATAAAGDWNGALAAFEQALAFTPDIRAAVAPDMALCYIKRAESHAREGRAINAAADLEAALGLDPALGDKLENIYASCALQTIVDNLSNGQLAQAKTDLKRVLSFIPVNKKALYVSGRLEEALKNLPAAAEAFAQALHTRVANPTPAYTAELRRRLEAELDIVGNRWKIETAFAEATGFAASATGPAQKLDTEHFVILHYNDALAREVASRAEAARDRVLSALKLDGWKGQARLFIHRTKAEYTAQTGQPEWTGGYSRTFNNDGRNARMEIHSWQTSPRLLTSVLPHEITHLVLNANMSDVRRLPVCLHEGFAVSMEPQFRADYYMNFLRLRLKSQDFIPLADLIVAREYPKDPEFFYAEGYALVAFLQQKCGPDAAMELFKNIAAKGQARDEIQQAFRAPSIQDLETAWKAWILKTK